MLQRSLLLVLMGWQLAYGHAGLATDDRYTLVSRIDEGESVVAVVHRNGVLHMLYDQTIIGAEFDDIYLRKQSTFPGFTIMQCAAYLQDKPTRAMQIGLGIGTVPSFLREMGIPTDVVEISDAVVAQAADYFQYEWCPQFLEEDDDYEEHDEYEENEERCPNGRTFVMDGLQLLSSQPEDFGIKTDKEGRPYDLFIVDVYTGWNPFAFFIRDEMVRIRENWLMAGGVLVMNFVGYVQGPRAAAPKSIYRTLQTVFKHVKCYRETEEMEESEASNIVFYASDKLFSFDLPNTNMYQNPRSNTYFYVVKTFPKWEIFTELKTEVEVALHQDVNDEEVRFSTHDERSETKGAAAPRVLTKTDHGQEDFREIHAYTQDRMREHVLSLFPPALWEEIK